MWKTFRTIQEGSVKKKIIWLAVSGIMVLSLVLASCAPAASPTTPTPPAAPITAATATTPQTEQTGIVKLSLKKLDGTLVQKSVEGPRYGGEYVTALTTAIVSWDPFISTLSYLTGIQATNDFVAAGDWTRGPVGTGETTWPGIFSAPYSVGGFTESWEIPDADTIILHIRKGIHWALNPNSEASRLVNGRELDANDVAYCTNRLIAYPAAQRSWFASAQYAFR